MRGWSSTGPHTREVPVAVTTLVIEELHLHRVLVGAVADLRSDVRVSALDVEVVAVRIPRHTALPTRVVVRVAGGGLEVLPFVSDPRHDLVRRKVVAELRRRIVLFRQRSREEARAAVEVEQ